MSFLSVNALVGSGAGVGELKLVIEEINKVIAGITEEQDALEPVAFAFGALIGDEKFGNADRSPALSYHYGRAHQVTWKTLYGIKEDLIEFRDACIAARDAISTADQTAADNLRLVNRALDTVAAGGHGRGSSDAHQDAQQEQDTSGGTL